MKILLWHGYLLTGSGSNVYAANVARSWRRRGDDVLVLCQERHADRLEFVDEVGTVDRAELQLRAVTGVTPARGRCRVATPQIGKILPVYVYDEYEGFTARLFVDLTDQELDTYVRHNVDGLLTAIRAFEPDVIITGHEVMGPFIARRVCEATGHRFTAKLHGSALEYAVKKQDRYRDYAVAGLRAASCVVGGSRYMVREAAAYIPGWEQRAVVVNPGCDIDLFRPRPRVGAARTIGFVGKFIAAKGVQNLIAALPLVSRADAAVIVGYGALDRVLRDLAAAISAGDWRAARAVAAELGPLAAGPVLETLDDRPGGFEPRDVDIRFTGRLEHEPLAELLPTFHVLTVPSIVPEAFGMVAAEAAAAGVLPVVPNHSGIAEAGAAVEDAIGRPGFLTYDAADPVRDLARALDRLLSLHAAERAVAERSAVRLARSLWSWDHVAETLVAHALA